MSASAPITMQKIIPAANSSCAVCLDPIQATEQALGHSIPEATDGKIYCLIHEKCLKNSVIAMQHSQCPTCRRVINANSILSLKDVDDKLKRYLYTRSVFEGIGYYSSAATGAFLFKIGLDRNTNICSINFWQVCLMGAAFPLLSLLFQKNVLDKQYLSTPSSKNNLLSAELIYTLDQRFPNKKLNIVERIANFCGTVLNSRPIMGICSSFIGVSIANTIEELGFRSPFAVYGMLGSIYSILWAADILSIRRLLRDIIKNLEVSQQN